MKTHSNSVPYVYTYRCVCPCNFQMEIRLDREIDFLVNCVRTGCDLIMDPILESKLEKTGGTNGI